jgi:hypothetical protein
MANVGTSSIKIRDDDGDVVSVTDNALDVNIAGGATIDIGDVDIFLDGGTALLGGAGAVAAGVLRTTLASDDPAVALLGTIDSDTSFIKSAVANLNNWSDGNYVDVNINLAGSDAPTGGGAESGALRVTLANDSTGVISIDDGGNTITVDGTVTANLGATDNAVLDAIAAKFPNWFVTDAGTAPSPVQIPTITYDPLDGIVTVGAVCKDVLAAHSGVTDDEYTTLQVDTQGALYTTHGITGSTSGANSDVGTSAENLRALGNVACKRVDMMASPDNTGYIWVGGSGLTADKGVRLAPGDFYSVDVNGTSDVQVLATVDGEDIFWTYYT